MKQARGWRSTASCAFVVYRLLAVARGPLAIRDHRGLYQRGVRERVCLLNQL